MSENLGEDQANGRLMVDFAAAIGIDLRNDELVQVTSSRAATRETATPQAAKGKRPTWKKPVDKPKRPLTAYNLFFQLERERIISGNESRHYTRQDVAAISTLKREKHAKKRPHRRTHGMITFADLARTIAEKWKALDVGSKACFEERASEEKSRYQKEVKGWTNKQRILEGFSDKESFLRKVSLDPSTSNIQSGNLGIGAGRGLSRVGVAPTERASATEKAFEVEFDQRTRIERCVVVQLPFHARSHSCTGTKNNNAVGKF